MKSVTKWLLGIGLMLLIVVIYFLFKFSKSSKYYNQVQLSENNIVLVNNDFRYYDTILRVGLDQVGLKNITVSILQLTDATKNNFDGELKAHLKLHEGIYYLYLDKYTHSESITIIAHEIIHIIQYENKQLIVDENTGLVIWQGQTIDLNAVVYDSRPWENDAFQKQNDLSNKIDKILYGQ